MLLLLTEVIDDLTNTGSDRFHPTRPQIVQANWIHVSRHILVNTDDKERGRELLNGKGSSVTDVCYNQSQSGLLESCETDMTVVVSDYVTLLVEQRFSYCENKHKLLYRMQNTFFIHHGKLQCQLAHKKHIKTVTNNQMKQPTKNNHHKYSYF